MSDHKSPRDEFHRMAREVTTYHLHRDWNDADPDKTWKKFLDEQFAVEHFDSLTAHLKADASIVAVELTVVVEPATPPLAGLMKFTAWVPMRETRKLQRKMLADEAAEIQELRNAGQTAVARWRTFWAGAYWLYFLVKSPVSIAIRAAIAKTLVG